MDEKELQARFGSLVAAHRRRAGKTQEQLASDAGLSVDMITRIEGGALGGAFSESREDRDSARCRSG